MKMNEWVKQIGTYQMEWKWIRLFNCDQQRINKKIISPFCDILNQNLTTITWLDDGALSQIVNAFDSKMVVSIDRNKFNENLHHDRTSFKDNCWNLWRS